MKFLVTENPFYSDDDSFDDADEKEYDSDNDPAWTPFAAEPEKRHHSDSDEEPNKTSRGRGRPIKTVSGGQRTTITPLVASQSAPKPKTVLLAPNASYEALDPAFVHDYQRGDFVIDRRHLTEYENYPIWKIDAGRLLQKYEPIDKDGTLCHSALSTYSSWSEDIRKSYKAIKVKSARAGGQKKDVVEVLDEFKPKPPDEVTEEDPMMPGFNVYLQILLSQALEPGFLKAITEEGDEYYNDPLQEIDTLLEKKADALLDKAGLDSEFLKAMHARPYYHITEHPSLNTTCQAIPKKENIACKKVTFYGHEYCRDTLEGAEKVSDKSVEPIVFNLSLKGSRAFPLCHGVHHYKFTLFKKCKTEVAERKKDGKTTAFSEVLDSCLQDRTWVQQLFREYKQLIETCDKKS